MVKICKSSLSKNPKQVISHKEEITLNLNFLYLLPFNSLDVKKWDMLLVSVLIVRKIMAI